MLTTRFTTMNIRKALAVLALLIAVPLAWLHPLDDQADRHLTEGLERAVKTYAAARIINAVVSALQETTVSAAPMGIGITFAPAQTLDSINDVVEQFASIMLVVCVSFAIQLVLLKIGGTALISTALSLALLWWVICVWRGRSLTHWESRLIVAAVVIRFAIPFAAIGSDFAFQHAMQPLFIKSTDSIELTAQQVNRDVPNEDLKSVPDILKEEGLLEKIKKLPEAARNFEWAKKWRDDLEANVNQTKTKYESIKERLGSIVDHIISLIAVFALQTVLLPLLLLWLMAWAGRLVVSSQPPR